MVEGALSFYSFPWGRSFQKLPKCSPGETIHTKLVLVIQDKALGLSEFEERECCRYESVWKYYQAETQVHKVCDMGQLLSSSHT